MCFVDSRLKRAHEGLLKLYQYRWHLENEDWDIQMQMRDLFEIADRDIAEFIEDDYCIAVYNCYAKRNPRLVRIKTGEKLRWQEAFGDRYEHMTPQQRRDITGLVEGEGQYRFRFRRKPWKETK